MSAEIFDSSPSEFTTGQLVRRGRLVSLRKHVPKDEAGFVKWYTDPDIAYMLRHDLRPLTPFQAQGYFSSIVLPNSAHGTAWAIHENENDSLIGTTAITELDERNGECLFRIVIGEKLIWNQGFGTDATKLVAAEAFERFNLRAMNLEVFAHNPRALHSYLKVGFQEQHRTVEWARTTRLDVIAMRLERENWVGEYRAAAQ